MLKNKFTFMLVNNMKRLKMILLILLFHFINYTLVFSQSNKKIYMPKTTLEISTPYLPHAIVTNGEEGFSFVYSYPGFFSYWGQASLYYTNALGDSYFGSIGEVYIMLGINKQIIEFQKSDVYLNANAGTFGAGYLGSLGISHLQQITNKSKVELVFDLYFNHGVDADMMVHDKTYSIGLLVGLNLVLNLTTDFRLNFGVGLSLVKYRYVYMSHSGISNSTGEYRYKYIPKRMEKYYDVDNLKWDSRFLIPFGVTLSYHF